MSLIILDCSCMFNVPSNVIILKFFNDFSFLVLFCFLLMNFILVGAVTGALHYLVLQFIYSVEFEPQIFYYVLLPIIIFESGYSMKKVSLPSSLLPVLYDIFYLFIVYH